VLASVVVVVVVCVDCAKLACLTITTQHCDRLAGVVIVVSVPVYCTISSGWGPPISQTPSYRKISEGDSKLWRKLNFSAFPTLLKIIYCRANDKLVLVVFLFNFVFVWVTVLHFSNICWDCREVQNTSAAKCCGLAFELYLTLNTQIS